MGTLIDSNVFIELERRSLTLDVLVNNLEPGENLNISSISVSELLAGVLLAEPEARRQARQAFVADIIQSVEVLNFDLACARIHADLWVHLRLAGLTIGPHDLLIAATALAHEHTVLTDNVREFSRIPGLEVRQPAW